MIHWVLGYAMTGCCLLPHPSGQLPVSTQMWLETGVQGGLTASFIYFCINLKKIEAKFTWCQMHPFKVHNLAAFSISAMFPHHAYLVPEHSQKGTPSSLSPLHCFPVQNPWQSPISFPSPCALHSGCFLYTKPRIIFLLVG